MTTAPTPPAATARLDAIDLLRGIIVVIMALDHTRDYFGDLALNPTDIATTTTALFFTRWITHFCAPVFFLLTGTGAWFSGKRRGPGANSRHLLTRGLWLIVLEFTLLRFALQFNVDYKVTILTVLWGIGWAMVVLAFVSRLPLGAILTLGVVMIAGHNLLDGIQGESFGAFAPLWTFLHQQGFLLNTPEHVILVAYPLIPWIGVTMVGYALGSVYDRPLEERVTFLRRTAAVLILGFLVLRGINLYGDPRPWMVMESVGKTFLSFLNATKQAPSLLFLCMTLGPALLLLARFERGIPRWLRFALPYGKVPLFFFLAHFALIHLLAVVASWLRFGSIRGMFESPTLDRFPITTPEGWYLGLPFVYLMWVVVVVLLYPACRWYARLRATGRHPWLSYF
jgi:uncharacterized membrane protein